MDWVTIDFEASCLPRHGRSYPIEVGISGPLGTSSWLIRPLPRWREWDWTQEAFSLHGISQARLDEEGLDPPMVLAQLRGAIGTARVIADSPLDCLWWQTLAEAAGPDSAAWWREIHIQHVTEVFDELGATADQIRFAQRRADWLCPDRHRAGADANWLRTLLTVLSQRIADDRADAAPWPTEVATPARRLVRTT